MPDKPDKYAGMEKKYIIVIKLKEKEEGKAITDVLKRNGIKYTPWVLITLPE